MTAPSPAMEIAYQVCFIYIAARMSFTATGHHAQSVSHPTTNTLQNVAHLTAAAHKPKRRTAALFHRQNVVGLEFSPIRTTNTLSFGANAFPVPDTMLDDQGKPAC